MNKKIYNVIDDAKKIISGHRQNKKNTPENSFTKIAAIWSTILGTKVTARQVAICMIGLKIARDCSNPSYDNLVDIAGYAQCADMVNNQEFNNETWIYP